MRNYQIDLLRGIAILLVLLHHFNISYKLHDTWLGIQIFGESITTLIARNGNYGVTLFFVISGFLITQHTLRRDGALANIQIKAFYLRRFARIIPCLLLLIGGVSLLGSLGLKPFINQAPNDIEVSYAMTVFSALTFWMNILIIENGWVNYALGVLWSLSVEEVFYLAFPLLCLILGRGRGLILLLLAVICYAPYFRYLHYGEESGAYLYHYFSSFDGIAMGCLAALLLQRLQISAQVQKGLIVLSSLLMFALYFYAPIKQVSPWGISVFAICAAVLIFAVAQKPQAKAHAWMGKGLAWVGQRSYELYLFHLVVLGLIKVFYFPKTTLPTEKLLLLPVFLILSLILSWGIEKYYSTPLNRWIRKRWG